MSFTVTTPCFPPRVPFSSTLALQPRVSFRFLISLSPIPRLPGTPTRAEMAWLRASSQSMRSEEEDLSASLKVGSFPHCRCSPEPEKLPAAGDLVR